MNLLRKTCALALVLSGVCLFSSIASAEHVQGYTRRDGTVVQPYERTPADGNPYNNYSYPGNFNPNTGSITGGSQSTYLENYYGNSNNQGVFGSSGWDPNR